MLFAALVLSAACSPADEDEMVIPGNSGQTQEPADDPQQDPAKPDNEAPAANEVINLTVNGKTRTVTLVDNPSTAALKSRLAEGSIQIMMSDYGNMEKVGSLGFSLPRNDVPTTTSPGDMVLYQGNSIVLFYGSNSWSYTMLGRAAGISTRQQMLDLLGTESVTVTHSLRPQEQE